MIRKTKDGGVVIMCSRSKGASPKEVEKVMREMGAKPEPMTSIPCGIGDHEDCGGDGCECDCHKHT